MSVFTFNVHGGANQRTMKLDLDENLSNEKTILSFVTKGQYYEPEISQLMLRVVRDGDTVIDVGANVGFFTILAATLVGSNGRVVSFEPDPANRARLTNNSAINGYTQCTLIESPVTDKPGTVEFFINSDDSGGNALWDPAQFPGNVRSQAQKKVMQVQATTLDDEIVRQKLLTPKLIKVDTEGADQRVLEGARKLLAKAAVPFVVSELHEFGLEKMNCSQESFRGYMEGLGYSTFTLYYSGVMPKFVPPATKIRSRYIANVLYSTPEQIAKYWPEHFVKPNAE
ncbi:MAG TPA: FkbM family methyltransferase [Magnetospirillaceae bacterium]|jgi:FkbM family methyltransferase